MRDDGGVEPSREKDTATGDWHHAVALDLRGLQCPLPVLRARKALLALRPGDRLLVEATDAMAAIDFPQFCAESGHRLIDSDKTGAIFRFLIERT